VPGLIERLTGGLIVSCQPVVGGPLDRPEFVVGFARAAEASGAAGCVSRGSPTFAPCAPRPRLADHRYRQAGGAASPVFITPEIADAAALAEAGADIMPSTRRRGRRPASVADLLAAVHGRQARHGGCRDAADAEAAVAVDIDIIGHHPVRLHRRADP